MTIVNHIAIRTNDQPSHFALITSITALSRSGKMAQQRHLLPSLMTQDPHRRRRELTPSVSGLLTSTLTLSCVKQCTEQCTHTNTGGMFACLFVLKTLPPGLGTRFSRRAYLESTSERGLRHSLLHCKRKWTLLIAGPGSDRGRACNSSIQKTGTRELL